MAGGRACIGTSGWSYRHWRGRFYPPALPAKEHLAFYASASIRSRSRHLLPADRARDAGRLARADAAGLRLRLQGQPVPHPPEAPHRLRPGAGALLRAGERARAEAGPDPVSAAGALPPEPGAPGRIPRLPAQGPRYAFEFRDPAWFTSEVSELLRARNAALCLYEFAGRRSPLELTADFVYIRLHGPEGAYQGSYGGRRLRPGPSTSRRGAARAATSGATSTTIRRATPRRTP